LKIKKNILSGKWDGVEVALRCLQLHRHFYATSLIASVSSNEHYFLNISTSYTSFMVFDHKYMASEALAEGFCVQHALGAR
jgi:hypothetical protein